ncbi:HAMP domain-containing histidine kinase [Haloarcula limicola]|nr:HAMP domain-containing histidine kinase [Halomicroarcula limicola]
MSPAHLPERIERYGGSVGVVDTDPRGSAFRVRLPRA